MGAEAALKMDIRRDCDIGLRFFENLRPRRVRSLREFAESEIILPSGPEKGRHFRCSFMPWTGLLMDEVQRAHYRQYWISGPVQDGKTTLIIIMMMYYLFEQRENIIFAAPKLEIAQGKFETEIKPMMMRSRYAGMVPARGRGSRGGKSEFILFQNGTSIRFMAAGGGDEQRSSFTARIVFITEADKMDEAGEVSRETDPISQVIARTAAYPETHLVFAECTLSTQSGRTYGEISGGTDSKVHVPCPRCGEYVEPKREHFTGWQDARDELEARERGAYACQVCGQPWTEKQRRQALRNPVIASRGQAVDRNGEVQGDPPRTLRFGFRWNSMVSAIKTQGYIASKEWAADRSEGDDAKKELMQFVWALPWEEKISDLSGLNKEIIYSKISRHPRGQVPAECARITAFMDLGLYTCWYAVVAWRPDAQGFILDYGSVDVPHPEMRRPDSANIARALWNVKNDIFDAGWQRPDGSAMPHDRCLVDSGHWRDLVYKFCREAGHAYLPSKGLGSMRGQDRWREPKKGKGRKVGHEWFISRQPGGARLVNMHSDYWKRAVHEGFRIVAGSPGSLSLFAAEDKRHLAFARQVLAERRIEELVQGKGVVTYWALERKDNHWLDCMYGCRCAADMLGIRPMAPEKKKVADPPPRSRERGERRVRGWGIGR